MDAALQREATLAMSAEQNERIVRAEGRLMAPCCYSQTIDVHSSDIAKQMRTEVVTMVRANLTEVDIYSHYKAIYGEQILAVPDGLLGQLAFAIPLTTTTIAVGMLSFVLYSVHRRKRAIARLPPTPVEPLSAKSLVILDEIRRATSW